ncbi:hypothetical protein Vafri_14027 [Volvox africanus]|uniref:C2 NT-type domain-containing protein n=1 Tax=Volvox africanus TaxID=51714 RepID=A0A8J4F476_9CHLO|nr:hypothetical protein Vafri_14027 [Volvox africanus]
MFGKILRAGKGGHGVKYKIDLQVVQLENLPTSIRKCRVVWARSAKLQMTDIKDTRGCIASFKQTLTQVTTIYRDKAGKYEPKEYEFKVQVPGKSSTDSPITVGKGVLDMAKYCKDETTTQFAMVPIAFKIGATITGYLKLSITTIFIGDSNEDGGTEVSGLTGLTSDHGSMREQDLEGFGDEEHAKFSKKARSSKREEASTSATGSSGRNSSNNKAEGPRRPRPLPPTAEEDDLDLEDKQEAEPALTTVKSSRRKSSAARGPEIEEAEESNDNPFAKKVSKPTARKVPAKVWEDDEDVSPLNSDVSDSEPPKTARSKKVEEPALSLEDMKTSLFSTKKTAGSAVTGVMGTSAAAAASSNKGGSSKASKIPPPPPPIEDEDDESQRDDLFSVKPKGGLAAPSNKMKATAATAISASAATTNAAAATAAAGKQPKTRTAPPPPPEDDEDEDEDLPPPTDRPKQYTVPAQKPRSKAVESSEAAMAKSSSALTRAGSKQDPGKGGSGAELEQLRKQVAQLEKQLLDEQVAKDDLSKKMQKYADKIADLEDQLAEGDLTELYAQMKEMEEKHQAEIKDMEAKYQTEIKELMERHLSEVAELDEQHQAEVAELQRAASESGRRRGGPSVEEIERLKAELAEQDALFETRAKKLAAEQAAANAAREVAETKLAAANKMIDDSLLAATKHQQENKALQEEVARLKRQVEDISMWDTSAAVAAATAASNNGRRDSAAEVELEELRERVEELEEENTRLQKLVSTRGRASRVASDGEDKKRFDELQAANRKLEAVCHDLEEKAHVAQEQAQALEAELEAAKKEIRSLEAAAATLQKRMEDEAAGAGGRQSREKVADLEARVSRLEREKATLEEQLEEEWATRKQLEKSLKNKLDRAGDDEAAETVAAFEVKYNRLKERYKMLEESSQEELDELQDQLTEALSQVGDLQRQVKQLQSQLAQTRSAGAVGGADNLEELRNLRSENERLVQQLVSKTMELAELSESEITIKRELARLQEVNRKLAQKATTLEAQAAVAQAGKPAKGKK